MENSQGICFLFEDNFLFEVIDATLPGQSREPIDVSHLKTEEAMEFIAAALVDSGELSVTMGFRPGRTPPINQPASAASIIFPGGQVWTFNGFLTNYTPVTATNDKMTATATVKVTGKINIATADSSSSA